MRTRRNYLYGGLFILLSAMNPFAAITAQTPEHAGRQREEKAVYALIKRIVPKQAGQFRIAFISAEGNKDVFEIEESAGKIILRGSNGVAVSSAFNYYLKYFAHCDISWNGTNLRLPDPLPAVPQKIRKATPYEYRYYLNYCTFNYSMSWWNWDRWEKEIDWMALNGINMPLAVTGQNKVWRKVYKGLGFTDKDLESFFSGPAYFNWFWMGNLDGWGGPLPLSWMKSHEALQQKILARERSLGMTPILPAFTGHVPPSFKEKFPAAKLRETHWTRFPPVYILDPNDPLFTVIGKKFIETETAVYGTDHFYSADTFNENTPPSSDSVFLNDVSKKVFQSMALADPQARWIMQGWLFQHNAAFWKPNRIKALLHAVPDDKMIILDLWSENHPVWNQTEAYYGKPWIWNMLHNFGGNISLYGRMDVVASEPSRTLHDPHAGKMAGIGLTPEGIEQNPALYELMLENVWRNDPIEVDSWLKGYARRRYGKQNTRAEEAWQVLRNTVYTGGILPGGPESIITGRPTLDSITRCTNPRKNYLPEDLLPAWTDLVAASAALTNSDGFRYDLVDVTRQVLANYADALQRAFAAAGKNNDVAGFQKYSGRFLAVMDDMDKLLATRKEFLLGKWLSDARAWGATPEEKNLYEKNARDLVTLWGDKNSTLNEYSCRQWSGMINGFYKPRWQQFFAYTNRCMKNKQQPDQHVFEEKIKDWEWKWVNAHDVYTNVTKGNSTVVAVQLYKKYFKVIKASHTNQAD